MTKTRLEYQQAQYRRYRDLIEQLGIPGRGAKWAEHMRELEGRVLSSEPRLTKAELRAWWSERYTTDEIWSMASSISVTSKEERAA